MESAKRINTFAFKILSKKGFSAFVQYLKKKLDLDCVDIVIKRINQVKTYPGNKVFTEVSDVSASEIVCHGTKISLPFFVSSSDAMPVPLNLYKLLKEHDFKGCFITSVETELAVLVIGCFKREPLKLTDEDVSLVNETLAFWLTKRLEKFNSETQHDSFLSKVVSSGCYVIEVDEKLNVLSAHGNFKSLLSLDADTIINQTAQTLDKFVDSADRKRLIRACRSVFRTGLPRLVSFSLKKADETKANITAVISRCQSLGKSTIIGIGFSNDTIAETRIDLFNVSTITLMLRFLKEVYENPKNLKSHFESLTEFFHSIIPMSDIALGAKNNGKIVFLRHTLPDEKRYLLSKLKNAFTSTSERIKELELDNSTKIICANLTTNFPKLHIFYFVSPKFPKGDYLDSLKFAVNVASVSLEIAAQTYSQRRMVRSQFLLNKYLSKLWTLKSVYDVGQKALEIAGKIIPSLRGWIGVANTQRTHIEGIAGFGPGVGLRLARSQVELVLRHDYLDQAIHEKKIQIVPRGAKMDCSGFNDVIKRLNLGTLLIAPILHNDEVVGVLILEPNKNNSAFLRTNLGLIEYLCFYLGLVINAIRFDYRLFEADKMKAISIFSAGLAHYLNNIFQSVLGNLSFLSSKVSNEQNEVLLKIVEGVQKGASLIKKLNDMASPTVKSFELINLSQLILENKDLYQTILEPNIKLEINTQPNLRPIVGNKGAIQQALLNIILNAKEAIEDKNRGKVIITLEEVKLLSNQVDPILPPGRYVLVKITDDGRGMTAEEVQSCFEPFFSTKKSASALWPGLGLATTYATLRAHGGLATASSQPGVGTTISLYFPFPLTAVLDVHSEKKR
ncbi:MAG: ATP-binding protein, partial [Deltaproteobacteria bacterium]|nr:ATP-binding protein [Deltaproteobacteria bacterium]